MLVSMNSQPDLGAHHRTHARLRTQLHRLRAVADAFAADPSTRTAHHTRGFARTMAGTARRVHRHLGIERELLFPLVSASSRDQAVTSGLACDLPDIDQMSVRAVELADQLARSPGNCDHAWRLARVIAELTDQLDRHVADAERELFPLIRGHVSADRYRPVARRLRGSLGERMRERIGHRAGPD